jgi:chromosome segregation ATPase
MTSNFDSFLCQGAAFAEHIASGSLTSEFATERLRLEGRIERLQTQHTEAVRDKSAAENKSRNLTEKLSVTEAEKEDLACQLAAEKEDADRACAETQVVHAKANLACAEANLALQHAAEAESSHRGLHGYLDKAEVSTRAGVDRAHALLVDAYQQLGACTTPFDASGEEVGLRFLGCL